MEQGVVQATAGTEYPMQPSEIADKVRLFVGLMAARERTRKHTRDTERRILEVIAAIGATRLTDLRVSSVQIAIKAIGDDAGLSLETRNRYISAIKGFARFLWVEGYLPTHPLIGLTKYNARLDRRHDRRALTVYELAKLYAAAHAGPVIRGMSGAGRELFYETLVNTGLRLNEARSLRCRNLQLAGPAPTITAPAAYTKNRRESQIRLPAYLAARLAAHVAGRGAHDPVFKVPTNAARMIQQDLAAAGVPYRDQAGRYADIHALRHTFITMLGQLGCSLRTVQDLARHQTAAMTTRYMHTTDKEKWKAIDALPRVEHPGQDDGQGKHQWSDGESNPDLLNAIQPSSR